jgi:hypothetical protein
MSTIKQELLELRELVARSVEDKEGKKVDSA